MINIENLHFFKEEVLVTELKQDSEKADVFNTNALPQDNSGYILYEVVKVGEKQKTVKPGDKVYISGQLPQEIKIKGLGVLKNIQKIHNAEQIFALHAELKV